jgi:hypothetical protein
MPSSASRTGAVPTASRTHLGILEKDYHERVRTFIKEDRITAMKQNFCPKSDEFLLWYATHCSARWSAQKDSKAQQKEFEETVGLDTVRIMKDQDLSYVRNQKSKDIKKVERLRATLHGW